MKPFQARTLLPAMQSKNYRLYFMGQGLSLIGTWMTQVATVWLVYHLSQSALLLGMVSFVSQLPNFVLVPFGGVLVDRWNRHQTLLLTQTLSMLQSFALATLALTGTIQIWHVMVLGLFQGLVNSIDAPTRQAFVPEIAEERENLANAIALNSSMVNSAKLIGPAIGGVLVASVGAGYCFLIDGFSYLAVLAGLLAMQLKPRPIQPGQPPLRLPTLWRNLTEGFVYTYRHPSIRAILLLVSLVSFLGVNYAVVLPIFTTQILHQDAHTLGLLMAASGIGALLAAMYLSVRQGIQGLDRLIAIAPAIVGICMVAFSYSRIVWFSALLLVIIGFGTLLQNASSNTLIQTLVDEDKRGRVMSLYLMAFLGVMPFGNLVKGSLISWIGAPPTVAISGGICILGALLFARQRPTLYQSVQLHYADLRPASKTYRS